MIKRFTNGGDNVHIVENGLTIDLYDSMRRYADMKVYDKEDIAQALKNTLYSTVVYDDEMPVAIGRVVGDGRIVFFLKDIVVHPDYRGKQVGKLVVNNLLDYIEKAGCEGAYIGLMAMPGTEAFYEKFGFIERPNPKFGSGMICIDRRK
ncbi:MAG: GNAT family N-acetyltransferase [Clostridium cadaveris]|uniref:N-acetyltransferase n=1 Tax=Clostridium cadaveris TaxID=1529 RepID=A0A316M6Q7_9CLOT|nr:GNAT family N-acetyltransferase [Clostridium cadaveris]MDY4949031.1 GNAT family N-acetyltransferase [Clostridium cadaveris]NME65485.1 GNAT family N-acetyltransferase [Clostridium cadaveris]NWK11943.1 GNAT family N-acetyltransferase [Clostridium cadaveris]PWL53671.1 MAG: N-acetyltransferase [Clostridium cadaveris]UFH65413.1 GNAT family N-acetyltransferase [Clostridium cadaveris]